jgi:2-hydroxychromene-2-carboxylate isomerase
MVVSVPDMAAATFYFDLGSPYAYLAAERVETVIPAPVVWQPILLGGLFKANGRSSWARADERRRRDGIAEVESRARRYGLPPVSWPDAWPSDYLFAMRAATFAQAQGAAREFALAGLVRAFQRGVEMSDPDNVREAAVAAGLDPDEVAAATQDPTIKQALRAATDAAHEAGVIGVPTVAVDGQLFWGDDRLEEAAGALGA